MVLLAIDRGPYYFTDSGSYLSAIHLSVPRRSRPVGVSVFWRALLLLHRTEFTLVLAQVLLLTASGLFAYALARALAVSRRLSVVCAAVVSLSPTALLYERFLLSDALASVLLTAGTGLVVIAVTRRRLAACVAAGVALGLGTAVRADLAMTILAAGLCILLLWRGGRSRQMAMAVGLFVLGAAPIVIGQMAWTDRSTGFFSLSPWTGVVAIARTAPMVDCRDPARPPAIRRQVCADGIPSRPYNDVVWTPGVVHQTLVEPLRLFRRDNSQLLHLAIQSASSHPLQYLRTIPTTVRADFGPHDPDAYEYTTAPNSVSRRALRVAGLPMAPTSGHVLFHPLLDAARGWAVARWFMVAAAVAALVRWRRLAQRRAAVAIAVMVAAAIAPALLVGGPVPRYVFGIEAICWPLAFALVASRRATLEAPRDHAGAPPLVPASR
jgi:hypothetical protein